MESQEKINQLQVLQQNLQNMLMQIQQFQNQQVEVSSALTELKSTDKAYRIVGKIMLASSKEELIKELEEKNETLDLRLKALKEQEAQLQKNIEKVQKEVIEEVKNKEQPN